MRNDGYFHQTRPEMKVFVPESAVRILEVGCGEGMFCDTLRRPDREIWGIEMDEEAGEHARLRCDVFFQGDFFSVLPQLPVSGFDAIVFNDVLEHFADPWDALIKCKPLLSEIGVVVASIPNFRFIGNLKEILVDKDFRYKPFGILDVTHLRFFTSRSMLRMFQDCGYVVIQHEGIRPCRTWLSWLLAVFSLGIFGDVRYKQFATVAKISGHEQ